MKYLFYLKLGTNERASDKIVLRICLNIIRRDRRIMDEKRSKKRYRIVFLSASLMLLVGLVIFLASYFNLLPKTSYTAEDFNIENVYSRVDYNKNGIDDYTDIMLGARIDAENHPKYDGSYYAEGYPPDHIGVCTDVVWRAFKNAGYSLRDMVDKDIINREDFYPNINSRDDNIDFRRVVNLRIFFEEHGQSLTLDIDEIAEWQPGDIVFFGNDKHIGIVSDKRNRQGQPYIIHNGGQPNREEDYFKRDIVTGHYRFDASKISEDVLVKW